MAERTVAARYLLGQDSDYPDGAFVRHALPIHLGNANDWRVVIFNGWLPNDSATNDHIHVRSDHLEAVRKIGAASTALLKLVVGALPLCKPRSIAMYHQCVFCPRPSVQSQMLTILL